MIDWLIDWLIDWVFTRLLFFEIERCRRGCYPSHGAPFNVLFDGHRARNYLIIFSLNWLVYSVLIWMHNISSAFFFCFFFWGGGVFLKISLRHLVILSVMCVLTNCLRYLFWKLKKGVTFNKALQRGRLLFF